MPSGQSHGEHSPQQLTLAKRERQLQRALAQMAPVHKLHAAAEHVRAAQLLVLKAHAENIRYSPTADPKRLRNIERQRIHWRDISVEAILVQYAV
jgi:hypothetical protein